LPVERMLIEASTDMKETATHGAYAKAGIRPENG